MIHFKSLLSLGACLFLLPALDSNIALADTVDFNSESVQGELDQAPSMNAGKSETEKKDDKKPEPLHGIVKCMVPDPKRLQIVCAQIEESACASNKDTSANFELCDFRAGKLSCTPRHCPQDLTKDLIDEPAR